MGTTKNNKLERRKKNSSLPNPKSDCIRTAFNPQQKQGQIKRSSHKETTLSGIV